MTLPCGIAVCAVYLAYKALNKLIRRILFSPLSPSLHASPFSLSSSLQRLKKQRSPFSKLRKGRRWLHPNLHFLRLQSRYVTQFRLGLNKNHGAVLIPEGLVESITEPYALLQEIGNSWPVVKVFPLRISLLSFHHGHMLYSSFCPRSLGNIYFSIHPESHDSAQLSQKEGTYKGKKFNTALPSKFDCNYAYITSTAGSGTLILEFGILSRLTSTTNDCQFSIEGDNHDNGPSILSEDFAKILLLSNNFASIYADLHAVILMQLLRLYFSGGY